MLELIIIHSLVVFAITLTITKSKIKACKRNFVEERFKSSIDPCFFHEIWNAIWVCSMCSGFWFALVTSLWFADSIAMIIIITFTGFSLNWLLHCLENYLFWTAKSYEISRLEND